MQTSPSSQTLKRLEVRLNCRVQLRNKELLNSKNTARQRCTFTLLIVAGSSIFGVKCEKVACGIHVFYLSYILNDETILLLHEIYHGEDEERV